jgi:hypothetical protein
MNFRGPALLFLILVSTLSLSALGQVAPSEFTTTYQFSHFSEGGYSINFPAGFSTGVNVPVASWFGVVGDFGYTQKSESATQAVYGLTASASSTLHVFSYGGGPQFTYRVKNANFQPFGRFLLGAVNARADTTASVSGYGSASGSASRTAFFIAPGGGADFRIAKNIWVRAGADYFYAQKNGVGTNGVRIFGGIQYRFGGAPSRAADQTTEPPTANARLEELVSIPALGITVAPRNNGAEIVKVSPQTNLHVGDVIISVNEKRIHTPRELLAELNSREAGQQVHLGYLFHTAITYYQSDAVVILNNPGNP